MKTMAEMNPFSILTQFGQWYEWTCTMVQMEFAFCKWMSYFDFEEEGCD